MLASLKSQSAFDHFEDFCRRVAFERFDTFDENYRQNFRRARTRARAREHHYTNFPLDLCIEYIGLTLAATPSAQMKMYMPCVAVCGLLTQTHAEL